MNTAGPCVLYARKSTEHGEKQILSIPAQVRELREFAARSGLTIVEEFEESCSAREPGRPVFSRLLKDAASGRVERILAWRLDRLARNPLDGAALIDLLAKRKLKELVTPEGTYTGTGDSKFMLSVLFGAATKMTDDLSAGVRRGNREVWKRGRIPGRPPLGYIKVRERAGFRGAGKVVPDPRRFGIVRRIWAEVGRGRPVAEVWRRAVDDWGLRTRETGNSPAIEPGVTSLYGMLRNPFYAGVLKTAQGTFAGEHEPMVTLAEFEHVQQLLTGADHVTRPSKHAFAYGGLLRCGLCQRAFVGERHVKPSGLVFTYYRCACSHRRKRCPALPVREDSVTADIDRQLDRLVLPEHLAAWTREALAYWAQGQEAHAGERVRACEKEIAQAERKLDRLTELVASGTLREGDYIRKRDQEEARIVELRKAIREPNAQLEAWRDQVEEIVRAGRSVAAIVGSGDIDARRTFLRLVCANLVVIDRMTRLALRFPFTLLDNAADVSRVVTEPCANQLPPPELVLNQTKSARRRGSRERALSDWCTQLFQVRTVTTHDDTTGADTS